MGKSALFPEGHFYSPVVDTEEIVRDTDRLWPGPEPVPGIDMQEGRHRSLLSDHFPTLLKEYNYPLEGPPDEDLAFFYDRNSQFSWLDSRSLFCLMRMIRPARVIEVGSGYSSLLMSDINQRFLGGAADIHCIEPHPRPFLKKGAESGYYRLFTKRVQDVDVGLFGELGHGDILFIDSSHVCKTGSDVTHLILKVLPRLNPGVYVHVHDVFLPVDYPRDWVISENRSWNEQYLLQALLAENPNFEVVFGASYAYHRFPDLVSAATGQPAYGGGSFWFQRRAADGAPTIF